MRFFKEIKSHYNFSVEDERLLASISQLMDDHLYVVMGALHSWLLRIGETASFFRGDGKRQYVFDSHKKWFQCVDYCWCCSGYQL